MIKSFFFFYQLFGRNGGRRFPLSRHRQRIHRHALLGLMVFFLSMGVLSAQSSDQSGQLDANAPPADPTTVSESYRPGESIDLVDVPAGSFRMGNQTTGDQNERPVHAVTLSGFRMSRTEITRLQYQSAGFSLPGKATVADDHPVTNVSWYDAIRFCNALSAKEGLSPVYAIKGKTVSADFSQPGYRLPTEAEWEYAARAAGREQFNYSGSDKASDVSWYDENSGRTIQAVARKAPNGLGLFDLSGNVWEWCQDYLLAYSSKTQTDPTGPVSGKFRIIRGGSFMFNDSSSRCGFRRANDPAGVAADIGFRVVRRP